MAWIIRNKDDHTLCWSNEDGRVTDTYDSFTDEERETLDLPIDGEWEQVPWSIPGGARRLSTYLIAYGANNELATFEAEDPAHAVEQFCDWAPVSADYAENLAAITEVMRCVRVDPEEYAA